MEGFVEHARIDLDDVERDGGMQREVSECLDAADPRPSDPNHEVNIMENVNDESVINPCVFVDKDSEMRENCDQNGEECKDIGDFLSRSSEDEVTKNTESEGGNKKEEERQETQAKSESQEPKLNDRREDVCWESESDLHDQQDVITPEDETLVDYRQAAVSGIQCGDFNSSNLERANEFGNDKTCADACALQPQPIVTSFKEEKTPSRMRTMSEASGSEALVLTNQDALLLTNQEEASKEDFGDIKRTHEVSKGSEIVEIDFATASNINRGVISAGLSVSLPNNSIIIENVGFQSQEKETKNPPDFIELVTMENNYHGNQIHVHEKFGNHSDLGEKAIRVEELPQSGKTSLWGAVFVILCQIAGGGDLGLAYAVAQGGVVAIGALVLLPFVCFYTAMCLAWCLYVRDIDTGAYTRVYTTYADLAKAAWPRFGRQLMLVLQIVSLIMISSMYLVLCGSFLEHSFPDFPLDKRIWSAIGAAVVFPLVFPKTLSKLAWASFIGVITVLVPIGITLWFCGTKFKEWDIKSIPLLDNSPGIAIALNIISMSYGVHIALLRLEESMAVKSHYKWAVIISYVFGAAIKLVIAIFGFLTFKSASQQLITNNLPNGVLTIISSCCLGIKVLCTYPILVFVAIKASEDIIPDQCCIRKMGDKKWFVFIRFLFVILTLGAAISIPQFGILLAFIGSIVSSSFVFILPCFFNLKLRFKVSSRCEKVCDVCIILLGFCACISGLIYAGKSLTDN